MKKNNIIETIMGGVVLVIAGFFLSFAYNQSGYKTPEGTLYNAKFDRADGLVIGSEVRVSGVKVGSVTDLKIDPDTFLANVSFAVDSNIALPSDSSAEIVGDGLIGTKYMALVPGGEEKTLKDGDEIVYTQSSVSLEAMIGQLIFNGNKEKTPSS